MKKCMFWKWSLGLSLTILPVVGGCLQETASPPVTNSILQNEVLAPPVGSTTLAVPAEGETSPPAVTNLENAAVTVVSTEKPVPADVKPSAPVSEIVKLANSGVDEGVMLAYVTNSASTFNLSADEIIYLKDIGVPGSVVTAMIDRDQQIRAASAQAVAAAQPAPATAPEPPAPAPAEVAPQVDPNATPPPAPPQQPVTASAFYDTLSPYGTWVNVEGYGLCWQPTVVVVNPTWRPYYDCGNWVYTDCGWYWRSDYTWGWAPFHYGRWFCHSRIGWCWAPGYVWGPSWVSWRYNNAYCGWAPLPPAACYRPGFGFTYYGRHAGASCDFGIGIGSWCFVSVSHFNDRHFHRYAVPHHDVHRVYNNTVVVNKITVNRHNTVVNTGIPPERVASASRNPIRKVSIREVPTAAPRTGRGDQLDVAGKTLAVYKPQITQPSRAPTGARPTREITKNSPAGGSTAPVATTQTVVPSAAYRQQHRQTTQMRELDKPAVNAPHVSPSQTATAQPGSSPTAGKTSQQPTRAEPLIIHGNQRPTGRSTRPQSIFAPAPSKGSQTAATQATPATRPSSAANVPPGLSGLESQSTTVTTPQNSTRLATPPRTTWQAGQSAPRPVNQSQAAVTPATPATPAAPSWSSSRALQTPSRVERQSTMPALAPPKANPGVSSRSTYTPANATPGPAPVPRTYTVPSPAPAPAPRTYSAPAYQPPARSVAEVPRYSAPSYSAPQRSYSAPAAQPAPRLEAPRPAPAPAPAPSRSSGGEGRGGGSGNGRNQR